MKNLAKLVLLSSVVALAACAKSTAPDTTADQAAVRAVQNSWYKAYNSGDGAAVAALYASDAVLMAPGVPAARGGASIQDYFARETPKFKSSGLTANEGPASIVGVSGDLAWQEDSYKVTDSSGATVEAGKTLTLFQRAGGKWMITRDTWNADAPAPITVASAPAATPQ